MPPRRATAPRWSASERGATALIALDWGTSSLRAFRLDDDGAVLERRETDRGILSVRNGNFAAVLLEVAGDWLRHDREPLLASGMIGSRQGWIEAPYVACPASIDQIAASLVPLPADAGVRGWIVPGVNCRRAGGEPDVMRGEETQILGVLGELPADVRSLCLPGTHSKWASLSDGRITEFSTWMTGEVFAVLAQHSILARTIEGNVFDAAAFDAGVARGREPLLRELFALRARGLFAEVAPQAAHSFLSGLLIGTECAAAGTAVGRVALVGSRRLTGLYARALEKFGVDTIVLTEDAAARGLYNLATRARRNEQ